MAKYAYLTDHPWITPAIAIDPIVIVGGSVVDSILLFKVILVK